MKMTRQVKAALMTATLALVFVGLQLTWNIATGIAGVFVMGMAGGLLIGNEMAKPTKQ